MWWKLRCDEMGHPYWGGDQTWCTSMVMLKDLPQKIVCIAWVGHIVTPIFIRFGIWQGCPRMWRLTCLWMLVPLYFRMAFSTWLYVSFSERERERERDALNVWFENWKPATSSILLTTNHLPTHCAENTGHLNLSMLETHPCPVQNEMVHHWNDYHVRS